MIGILKPWYVWRPQQAVVRLLRTWSTPPAGYRPIKVAWGISLLADPARAIGRSMWTTGIYDLAVSEVIARIVNSGDTVVDAGANVGYMTLLSAVVAGPGGTVLAFEPNPDLYELLERNVADARRTWTLARVNCSAAALGARSGIAELVLPDALAGNDGLAYIADGQCPPGATVVSVPLTTVDEILPDGAAGLLKLDVEQYELRVIEGAQKALRDRRIPNVLFEDLSAADSPVRHTLESWGFTVFSVGWSLSGPVLAPFAERSAARYYEAPSYLATLDPEAALRRCAPAGWRVLRSSLAKRI